MKVVFLCGGIGKRMFPITEDKFLLNFLGKSLLEHQIELATNAGLKEFVIICNPLNENKIRDLLKSVKAKVEYTVQKEPKGMADAILSTKDILKGEIFVVNPNDVFEITAYENLLKEAKNSNYDSYIVGYKVSSYFPGGYLKVNDESELIEIVEKPGEGNEPSDLVNIVIHLHKDAKTLVKYLESTRSDKDDVYERSISRMVADKHKIKVVSYSGVWLAIKYPWHIFDVTKFFLDRIKDKQIASTATISNKAVIDDNVIIEDNVKIYENATIRGPCYIGKNSIIGNNALIWNYSHIGENCVVGFSSEIKHSYIGNNCWFHSNYIGDSIISNNCAFGAGTITGNLRFDNENIKVNIRGEKIDTKMDKFGAIIGENCKTGINVSLMPGVRIGPNSIVGPNVMLREDLEPNTMIFLKQEHMIKENTIKTSDKREKFMRRLLKK